MSGQEEQAGEPGVPMATTLPGFHPLQTLPLPQGWTLGQHVTARLSGRTVERDIPSSRPQGTHRPHRQRQPGPHLEGREATNKPQCSIHCNPMRTLAGAGPGCVQSNPERKPAAPTSHTREHGPRTNTETQPHQKSTFLEWTHSEHGHNQHGHTTNLDTQPTQTHNHTRSPRSSGEDGNIKKAPLEPRGHTHTHTHNMRC